MSGRGTMSVTDRPVAVPTWVDMPRLCAEICCSPNTVDAWVSQGILPPPRRRGGKSLWKWAEVDEWLTNGPPNSLETEAERIRNAARREAQERRAGH